MNDLTVSNIERQNILNNKYAVAKIQESLGFVGIEFEGEYRKEESLPEETTFEVIPKIGEGYF